MKETPEDLHPSSREAREQSTGAKAGLSGGHKTVLKRELLEKVASLEAEVAQLQRHSERAQHALQEERDRLLRALAHERNLRNRAAAEEGARLNSVKEQALCSFLPLLDDFDRALSYQDPNPDSLRQGLEIILRQLRDTLASHGVEEMTSLGQPFDPNCHEAVGTVSAVDLPQGTVATVQRKGFLLDGKVLRPAQVVVATNPPEEPGSETPGPQPSEHTKQQGRGD